MGAQSSVPLSMKGHIRLRRRAPTMGITTNAELESAGVEVESAVHLAEEHLKAAVIRASGVPPGATATAKPAGATCPVTGTQKAPSACAGNPPHRLSGAGSQSPGTPPRSKVHPSAAALNVELPPWEVVASLGESEWFAFKQWLEAGWKCKHCGHVRDDHGDHPKAVRLLQSCGVSIPGIKGPGSAFGSGRLDSPSSGATGATQGVLNYGSESDNAAVGYLSDSSSRVSTSSRGTSPGRPAAVPVPAPKAAPGGGCPHAEHTGKPDSPRFHDSEGAKHLSFPDHLKEMKEEVLHTQEEGAAHLAGHRPSSGPMEPKHDMDGNSIHDSTDEEDNKRHAPHLYAHGAEVPHQHNHHNHKIDDDLGPSACPHLAALGLIADVPGAMAPSTNHKHHHSQNHATPPRPPLSFSGGGGPHVHLPDEILRKQEHEINVSHKILRAVTRANQIYFLDKEPNGSLVFDYLLSALLDVTNSPYGFISSALLKADGTPYLKTHAISNLAWNKELKAWYAANAHKGLVFTNLNSLHGSIVYTGQPVICNDVAADPRSRGLPEGHPPIDRFLGIPLFTGSELIGIYGVANAAEDYTEAMMHTLEPLTLTIAQMMYAVNERKRRKEAELQLSTVVQIAREGIMSMSYTGQITSINMSAREMFGQLPRNFARVPGMPPQEEAEPSNDLNLNLLIPEIDGKTNYLRRGLEPQAGHRHRGMGRRKDGSIFPVEVAIAKGVYGTVFYVAVVRDLTEELNMKYRLEACVCGQGGRRSQHEEEYEEHPIEGAMPGAPH